MGIIQDGSKVGHAVVNTGFLLTSEGVPHYLVHKDNMKNYGYYSSSLPAASSITIGLQVADITDEIITEEETLMAGVHSRIDITVLGGVRLEIFEVSDFTGGTTHNPYKLNLNGNTNHKSSYFLNPTLVSPVAIAFPKVYGSTVGGTNKTPASIPGILETIFAPNKKYAIKITSLVNGTEVTLDWLNYERFLK